MRIKSQKIIGQNGKVREHYINKFNSKGLIERTEYFDEKGQLKFYSVFSYDLNGNCVLKKEYDAENIIQISNKWEFDSQNREIKFFELTAENIIWEWYEKQYLDKNTIVYISKDENGKIIHRTVENTETKKQERFGENGKLYSTIINEFDNKGRLINSKTVDEKGKITTENKYLFIGRTEIKESYENGRLITITEIQTDNSENQLFYIRKNNKGKSLEWLKREFDEYGNIISIENGQEIDKPTHKSTIEIEYLKE